jgi:hypothetical protein
VVCPYPLDRAVAGALLGAYGLALVIRPALWLVLLPALWPVVDLAPWSGHIHFTESDALALVTLAALGLREAFAPPVPTLAGRAPVKLQAGALGAFGLLAASVAIAACAAACRCRRSMRRRWSATTPRSMRCGSARASCWPLR